MTCDICGGKGFVVECIPHQEVVTSDMASDAGEPDMAGMLWDFGEEWVQVQCPICKGESS